MSFLACSYFAEYERAGCFTFLCSEYHVALPRDSMGWSVVCDSGISWSYSLTFVLHKMLQNLASYNACY